MTNQLLASGAAVSQRLVITECAPCAIWYQWQTLRRKPVAAWTGALADLVVDVASAAVMLGGAREVLVPGSLVHYVEAQRAHCPQALLLHVWDTLRRDGRLVPLLEHDEVDQFVTTHCTSPQGYRQLCVPMPAGPLASRLLFGPPMEQLYDCVLPRMRALCHSASESRHSAVHEGGVAATAPIHWRAWMRSALTCRYEGTFVAPIRVAECTARLLREGGCDAVVWEAAVAGLTPRWLETMAKTALACGVPLGSRAGVCLALPAGEGDRGSSTVPHLLYKATEMGVHHFATCSLRSAEADADATQGSLFAHTETLCSALDVTQFAVGCNEQEQRRPVTADEEAQLEDCVAFMRALRSSWQAHIHALPAPRHDSVC